MHLGVHPVLIAACVKEMSEMSCHACLGAMQIDEDIPFSKCARQGGRESAWLWNLVMKMVFSMLVPLWIDSGYALSIEGCTFTHCIFADNLFCYHPHWILS